MPRFPSPRVATLREVEHLDLLQQGANFEPALFFTTIDLPASLSISTTETVFGGIMLDRIDLARFVPTAIWRITVLGWIDPTDNNGARVRLYNQLDNGTLSVLSPERVFGGTGLRKITWGPATYSNSQLQGNPLSLRIGVTKLSSGTATIQGPWTMQIITSAAF